MVRFRFDFNNKIVSKSNFRFSHRPTIQIMYNCQNGETTLIFNIKTQSDSKLAYSCIAILARTVWVGKTNANSTLGPLIAKEICCLQKTTTVISASSAMLKLNTPTVANVVLLHSYDTGGIAFRAFCAHVGAVIS